MAVKPILTEPNETLRQISCIVGKYDTKEEIENLLKDLEDTMYVQAGLGLAAPQIGVLKRVFVIRVPTEYGGTGEILRFINPLIKNKSTKTNRMIEGCLSVTHSTVEVERWDELLLQYETELGGEIKESGVTGFVAAVIQHEIEHLNGGMILDHLSPLKKTLLQKKLKREIK